jgi:prefoldin subunit 5
MKNYLIVAAMGLLMLQSCNNNKAELERSNRERDSLMAVINDRDSSINDFLESFNEIQMNLDSVTTRGNVISRNMGDKNELQASSKERINENISAINQLMTENRQKIAELDRKLKNAGGKNRKLQKMVESLNAQMAQKDMELSSLNDQLAALNADVAQLRTSVDTLTYQNTAQSQTISEQTMALHSAYYVIGKAKDLEENGVIDKKGGLLGMGKTATMSQKFDNSKFTKIDYTQVSNLPINSKAKVITPHPEDAYSLDKDEKGKATNLRITVPEKFWSASKYLVVVTE